MSQLSDLETAMISAVAGIESGGSDVFADVQGFGGPVDASVRRRVGQLRKPAAMLGYLEQRSGDAQRWTVLLAAEGLRDPDEARLGASDTTGVFELSRLVRAALDGVVLSSGDRLQLEREHLLEANGRVVLCQQMYAATLDRTAPTFGGQVLCGTDSVMAVTVGPIEREAVTFAFPGIDGIFRHELGLRGRPIVWQGELRAASDSALNVIVDGIETALIDPTPRALTDGSGGTFQGCVLERFEPTDHRRVDPLTDVVSLRCRLTFVQVATA